MRTFKNLWLGLALAVALVGLATASSASTDTLDATASGVTYEWHGDLGELSLVGTPGTHYSAYDVDGNEVGHGVFEENQVSFLAGNAGVGPDGTIIYVIVDSEIVAVTDPDWNWD